MGKRFRPRVVGARVAAAVIAVVLLGAAGGDASQAGPPWGASPAASMARPSAPAASPASVPPLLFFNVSDQPVVSVSRGANGVLNVTGVEPSPDRPGGLTSTPPAGPAGGAGTASATQLPGFTDTAAARALGTFGYTAKAGGAISEDPGWVKANIVTESVPLLGPVTCNRQLFPELIGALEALQSQGLGGLIEASPLPAGSCWDPRYQGNDPAQGLSYHAWGLAITLNAAENRPGGASHQDPHLVAALAAWGFEWAGSDTPSEPADFVLPHLLLPVTGPVTVSMVAPQFAMAGSVVTVTAQVAGGTAPTGDVMMQAFRPGDPSCSGAPVATVTGTLMENQVAATVPSLGGPGRYDWQARYAGDALNHPSSSGCGSATTAVTEPPVDLELSAVPSVALGSGTAATVDVRGGLGGGGGTLTFLLFGPADPNCTRDPAAELTQVPGGPGSFGSGATVPVLPGSYEWVATYSGDDGSPPTATICGDTPVEVRTP